MSQTRTDGGTILALAGRRIDAPGTDPPRFPLDKDQAVRRQLAELLGNGVTALVCSAACGADLIALEEAERLGLRRRIVLPFGPEEFRRTSVTDRPGNWGQPFDRLVNAARYAGDLVVLDEGRGDAAYAAANRAIIHEARSLADATGCRRLLAVIVWEGAARPSGDATADFRNLALAAGFEQEVVRTT